MSLLNLRFCVYAPSPEKALSSLIRSDIPFSRPYKRDGALLFTTGISLRRRVIEWAKNDGYRLEWKYEGTITLLSPLKRHSGIIFGTIIALFFIYLSTFYVWSVRIEGNSTLSDSEIIKLLHECGFSEGVRKGSIDVNEIQNTALTRCHDLSFLSINIHGMVADVVVHERHTSPKAPDPNAPYNLVADTDGIVVSSVVLDGQTLFSTGDTVFKGQLLVSGLVDSSSGITAIRHARGKVFARTNRALTFTVPYRRTETVYTRTETVVGIRLLGKSFYRMPADKSGNYDVTVVQEDIRLLGLLLPAVKETRTVKYYSVESITMSPDEAEQVAYNEYHGYISTELDSAEILNEVFTIDKKEDCLILTAEVTAIENIATEKKFELTE